ncbi:MAG: hypothetical protein GY875_07320 [Gammaproteobacteria bacterium]|nr:hypothetical protein [Gammaproteobacteria bacterium]
MTKNETIQGKALVVGANGGMGRAVALALAQLRSRCGADGPKRGHDRRDCGGMRKCRHQRYPGGL